jgi:excisionase family DNA binding protein
MQLITVPNVLTLAEAAEYLRLSPESLVQQVELGNIPGQQVNEDWRFLRGAIDDWLRRRDQRSVLLRHAGVFADDETLDELQASVDRARQQSRLN